MATKSLLFVVPLPKNPQWEAADKCMSSEAKVRGLDYTSAGPTGSGLDTTTMIQQIQQGIANHKGAIVTFPASNGFGRSFSRPRRRSIVSSDHPRDRHRRQRRGLQHRSELERRSASCS